MKSASVDEIQLLVRSLPTNSDHDITVCTSITVEELKRKLLEEIFVGWEVPKDFVMLKLENGEELLNNQRVKDFYGDNVIRVLLSLEKPFPVRCPVCDKDFICEDEDRSPQLLFCGHSICFRCLRDYGVRGCANAIDPEPADAEKSNPMISLVPQKELLPLYEEFLGCLKSCREEIRRRREDQQQHRLTRTPMGALLNNPAYLKCICPCCKLTSFVPAQDNRWPVNKSMEKLIKLERAKQSVELEVRGSCECTNCPEPALLCCRGCLGRKYCHDHWVEIHNCKGNEGHHPSLIICNSESLSEHMGDSVEYTGMLRHLPQDTVVYSLEAIMATLSSGRKTVEGWNRALAEIQFNRSTTEEQVRRYYNSLIQVLEEQKVTCLGEVRQRYQAMERDVQNNMNHLSELLAELRVAHYQYSELLNSESSALVQIVNARSSVLRYFEEEVLFSPSYQPTRIEYIFQNVEKVLSEMNPKFVNTTIDKMAAVQSMKDELRPLLDSSIRIIFNSNNPVAIRAHCNEQDLREAMFGIVDQTCFVLFQQKCWNLANCEESIDTVFNVPDSFANDGSLESAIKNENAAEVDAILKRPLTIQLHHQLLRLSIFSNETMQRDFLEYFCYKPLCRTIPVDVFYKKPNSTPQWAQKKELFSVLNQEHLFESFASMGEAELRFLDLLRERAQFFLIRRETRDGFGISKPINTNLAWDQIDMIHAVSAIVPVLFNKSQGVSCNTTDCIDFFLCVLWRALDATPADDIIFDYSDDDGFRPFFHRSSDSNGDGTFRPRRDLRHLARSYLIRTPIPVDTNSTNLNDSYFLAATNGHLEFMKKLIAYGAKPIVDDSSRLSGTVDAGRLDILRELLQRTSIKQKDDNLATLLLIAARRGFLRMVRELLSRGASVNRTDTNGATALLYAAQKGYFDVVVELLSYGAAVDTADNKKRTPLMVAVQNGYFDVVNELLNRGASAALSNEDGLTALMISCNENNSTIVRELLIFGASVDQENQNGDFPLLIATRSGNVDIVVELIAGGASVEGNRLLHLTAERSSWKIIRHLLATNIPVNRRTTSGESPLFLAALTGNLRVVRDLLFAGAEVNVNVYGSTPLMAASQEGYLEIVEILLMWESVVDSTNSDGETPLFLASQNGHWKVMRELIKFGAAINTVAQNGMTALLAAAQNGHSEAVETLLWAGALVNHQSPETGATPLHAAIQNHHVDVVAELLAHEASTELVDKLGDAPRTLATRLNNTEIMEILDEEIVDAENL